MLVIGDSHADQWFARALDRGADVTFLTRDGCAPLPDVRVYGVDCADFYRTAMAAARSGPYQRIVITAFWQNYLREGAFARPNTRGDAVQAAFATFAQDLARLGPDKKVVLVLPDLEPPGDLPLQLAKAAFFGGNTGALVQSPRDRSSAAVDAGRQDLMQVAASIHAETVDPLAALCGPALCRFVDAAGHPLFRDSNHLRSSVTRKLQLLDPEFESSAEMADANRPAPSLRPSLP